MKHRSKALSALAVAAAMITAPAYAATQAHASAGIWQLKLELIDLTPNDGQTPWVNFVPDDSGHPMNRPQLKACGPFRYSCEGKLGLGEVDWSGPEGSARATISDTSTTAQSSVTVGSQIHGTEAYSTRLQFFTLSPNTTMRVTGIGALQADDAPGALTYAKLFINLGLYAVPGGAPGKGESEFYQHDWHGDTVVNLSVSVSSGADQRFGGYSYVTEAITQVTSPVPEPATWGMLLTGLVTAGAAVRRRRGQQA